MRPMKAITIPAGKNVTFMKYNTKKGGDIIVIGYDDGNIELVVDFNFDKRMSMRNHDAHNGAITSALFTNDENFFVSVGTDGLTNVYQFDKVCAVEESKFDPLEGVEGANFMPQDEKESLAKKRTE